MYTLFPQNPDFDKPLSNLSFLNEEIRLQNCKANSAESRTSQEEADRIIAQQLVPFSKKMEQLFELEEEKRRIKRFSMDDSKLKQYVQQKRLPECLGKVITYGRQLKDSHYYSCRKELGGSEYIHFIGLEHVIQIDQSETIYFTDRICDIFFQSIVEWRNLSLVSIKKSLEKSIEQANQTLRRKSRFVIAVFERTHLHVASNGGGDLVVFNYSPFPFRSSFVKLMASPLIEQGGQMTTQYSFLDLKRLTNGSGCIAVINKIFTSYISAKELVKVVLGFFNDNKFYPIRGSYTNYLNSTTNRAARALIMGYHNTVKPYRGKKGAASAIVIPIEDGKLVPFVDS